MIKLISWNVAGRTRDLHQQVAAVARTEPDLVALQEVRESTVTKWSGTLEQEGLRHSVDSSGRTSERKLFNLLASRWPLELIDPPPIGQTERIVSALVHHPQGTIEIHNVHVPPAPSQGLAKVETLERLHDWLAVGCDHHRILCGDFTLPRLEYPDGSIETFASNHPDDFGRWDRAERLLLTDLAAWDLEDVFRRLNGFESPEASWFPHRRNPGPRLAGHRLDHVLASSSLKPVFCEYQHGWREMGLSDHSALEAICRPMAD